MPSYVEAREELATKRAELAAIFEEAGPELDMSRITRLGGDNAAKQAEIKRRNDELTALGQTFDQLALMEMIRQSNATETRRVTEAVGPNIHAGGDGNGGSYQPRRTLKALLEDSKPYRAFRGGRDITSFSIDLPYGDFKTIVTLTGVSPQAERRDVVPMALESRTVADLLTQGNISSNTTEYYEETAFTNAADVVAEGGTKQESVDTFTLRTETVRKIAHNIPATKEALDDVAWLESHLRGRLAFGVRRKEEDQILNGSGAGINILGLLNRAIQSTAIAAGTALIVSRPYAEVLRREDVGVTVSTEHSTFFVENKVMLQAESRLALACYRPSAFAKVTALT
jgi:HK97 family phage major capsid protein